MHFEEIRIFFVFIGNENLKTALYSQCSLILNVKKYCENDNLKYLNTNILLYIIYFYACITAVLKIDRI